MRLNHTLSSLTILLALAAGVHEQAAGQCILANPSFEIGGSGGDQFGGWSQFGVVGVATAASHGAQAARVTGPNYGDWCVSGYWQRLDSSPGEQWEATGHVQHPSGNPLTGQCAALVNIEWRDAGGDLIDYDSFTVADASTPTDEYFKFSVLSTPAPAGTVAIHFLLGVLQSPSDPPPDVYFDQVTCYSTTPPTIDDMQWNDFPGGRTVEFANRTWHVKGPGYYGPGPSNFCHLPECVWTDDDGRLHLTITHTGSTWHSTEVVLGEALGYGDYVFTTVGSLDQLDVHTVLGLFLWQYGQCWDPAYLWWNPYNEIDVEIARWGNPWNDIGQFVAQPYDWPGNISRFDASFGAEELSSYAFNWLPDRVEFRCWHGAAADESPENMIHEWTYTGPHIPRPEQPRVHMNLWQFNGPPDTEQEVIVADFSFLASGATGVATPPETSSPSGQTARLHPVSPNPFNPATRIRFDMLHAGVVEIAVFNVAGARVRTLHRGFAEAGTHETAWDGRDDDGRRMTSGVYLCMLRTGDVIDAQRMVLIK